MESENSGQSRKEKLKIVYNLGNRKQMTLFGTRQATQDLEMEDAQNDEVKKKKKRTSEEQLEDQTQILLLWVKIMKKKSCWIYLTIWTLKKRKRKLLKNK